MHGGGEWVLSFGLRMALKGQCQTWRTVYESGIIEAARAPGKVDLAMTAWLAFTVPEDLQILSVEKGVRNSRHFRSI